MRGGTRSQEHPAGTARPGSVAAPLRGSAEAAEWIAEVKARLPAFLRSMQGTERPGFYRYSYSGDRYTERSEWGLGNTVFAAKCWYTIGAIGSLDGDHRDAMCAFIRSFRDRDGLIYDRFLRRRALAHDLAVTLRGRRWRDPPWAQAKRAESRQAYSALMLLGDPAEPPTFRFMASSSAVARFIDQLDWTQPWSAGSHVSHLLFFLTHGSHPDREALIDQVVARVHDLQRADGAWYVGEPDLSQKINGAMKVITGLKVAGRTNFDRARPLIDLCLAAAQDSHACDNFNVVYVLEYATNLAHGYRDDDVQRFCLDRLNVYRRYHHPETGGFSFWEGAANERYYGALVSEGHDEPDLHGTALFMWGLAVIAQLLRVNDELQLAEFDP
jgi:hypothetical protein